MAGFTIDGSPVNGFAFWRHRVEAGRPARSRVDAFSGDAGKYVTQGVGRPGRVVVTGKLEAASLADLAAALDTLEAYRTDGLAHDIALTASSAHGGDVAFTNCACVDVRGTNDHRPEEDDDGVTLRRPVVMVWERLGTGGVS